MKKLIIFSALTFFFSACRISSQDVRLQKDEARSKIDIFIGDKYFTSYCYSSDKEKPFLFPVLAPNGTVVTRGYPIEPRIGDRADHPHQTGLWFNHGAVNGLDFWGNSAAIPASDKGKCGHIVVTRIVRAESGERGKLEVLCDWLDNSGKKVMSEKAIYIFSGKDNLWTIDHISTLIASDKDVVFSDSKEGMFAIRVDRAFEMPSGEQLILINAQGAPEEVKGPDNTVLTGMYLASNGKTGDAVWGTRNKWVILNGKKDDNPVSMAIFDNPSNYGYPAYFHARGYGLFSINNFGSRSYDPSQEKRDYRIVKGESVKLAHRFCVQSGSEITPVEAEKIFKSFSEDYK